MKDHDVPADTQVPAGTDSLSCDVFGKLSMLYKHRSRTFRRRHFGTTVSALGHLGTGRFGADRFGAGHVSDGDSTRAV